MEEESLSFSLSLSCSSLPRQSLLPDDQMLWGLPQVQVCLTLSLSLSLQAGFIVSFHHTVNNDLCSLRVFYLRDILAYSKNLTSFPSPVFCFQAPSSGSQIGSVLGHLSLAKTRGSLLLDSIPLTEFLSYDSLILFSVLRNPLH